MQKIGNVETGTKNILSLQKFRIVKTKPLISIIAHFMTTKKTHGLSKT